MQIQSQSSPLTACSGQQHRWSVVAKEPGVLLFGGGSAVTLSAGLSPVL